MIQDMPKPKLRHVHVERTRHGRVVFYFRRGSGPRVRLPDMADKGFEAAYAACLAGSPRKAVQATAGSLAWLIARYKESGHWANLRPSTRQARDDILKHIIETSGEVPFKAIKRRHINDAMDRRPRHAGNNFRKVMSQLFAWALSMDLVEVNPVEGATRHKIESDGFHTWTVAEVEQFCAKWSLGTRERLAMDLMLFTGLRRSDVCRLGRQHVTDNLISLKTEKTGAKIHVPIFPALKASIDAAPTGDLVFIATQYGKPFTSAASFGNWFGRACRDAGVPGRAHGLRKAGATIAADNGATVHALMAMYGWRKIAQAEVYTREANNKRLAAGSAELIANAFSAPTEPGAEIVSKKQTKSKVKK